MLEKILDKARQGVIGVKEFVAGEHEVTVSQETLNRMAGEDENVRAKLEEAGVEDVALEVLEGGIVVRGRFRKSGVSGDFRVRMEPGEPVWEQERHAIRLKIVDQNIDFDRNITGVMAGLGAKVAVGLLGWDVLGGRVRAETEGGVITLDLDGHGTVLNAVVASIRPSRLECRPGRVALAFRLDPQYAMDNAKALLTWWTERKGSGGRSTGA